MNSGSFIVEWWSRLLYVRSYFSPHWWLLKLFRPLRNSYGFVDAWVIGNFLVAICLFVATGVELLRWAEVVFVVYGGIIVIEGFLYEVDLLLFHGYRAAKRHRWYRVLSHRRLVVTSLQNYVSIVFWFAFFYRHWSSGFRPASEMKGIAVDPWLTWLRLSVHTMTGFGQAPMVATERWTMSLTTAQTAIGVFMALLIVGSFVRLLPEPGSQTRFEQKPPYQPIYRAGWSFKKSAFGRSRLMGSETRECLAVVAVLGGFSLAGLSLLLSYLLLASTGPGRQWWGCMQAVGVVTFLVAGLGLGSCAFCFAARKCSVEEARPTEEPRDDDRATGSGR